MDRYPSVRPVQRILVLVILCSNLSIGTPRTLFNVLNQVHFSYIPLVIKRVIILGKTIFIITQSNFQNELG